VRLTGKILTAGLAIGGTLGALTFINKSTVVQAGELNAVLAGEERRYPWKYGDIFYQIKGPREAQPLVLIHSFAPGASSYEWRKNVDTLAEQFRVYVLDLLGAGLSDRPAIEYTPDIYIDLIGDFLKEVIGQPTLVVAHGLTSAYTVVCAYRRPQWFEKVLLVSPPSVVLMEPRPDMLRTIMKSMLKTPIVGEFVYNMLTSHNAIQRYCEQRGYHNQSQISNQLLEYLFSSAHQENSYYSGATLYSKELLIDIREPLARLHIPIIAVWGREEEQASPETSERYTQVNPKIETRIFERCKQQLQDEQAAKFNALVREMAHTPIAR
jgi:pimeloyl-ACP methyl ester carboxylesterase